jgi:molecular chaperone IbpA
VADYVQVLGARLENGVLTIELARELPDLMKPRRIAIESSNQPEAVESQQAA